MRRRIVTGFEIPKYENKQTQRKFHLKLQTDKLALAALVLMLASSSASAAWINTSNNLGDIYNADTLASSTSDSHGIGYLGSDFKFLENTLPTGRSLTVDGIPFEFADDPSQNNTLLLGPGRSISTTADIEFDDRNFNEIAILYSAVGLNIANPSLNGQVTLHYTNGSSTDLFWDLDDSATCCNDGDRLLAVGDLSLFRFNGAPATFPGRSWWYQRFTVDDSLLLDRVTLNSANTGSDPGNDAETGVYAISGFDVTPVVPPNPVPVGNSLPLFALLLTFMGLLRRNQHGQPLKGTTQALS